jgi:hypothetical protein
MTPAATLAGIKPAIEGAENYFSTGTQALVDAYAPSLTDEVALAAVRRAREPSVATISITSADYRRLMDSIRKLMLEEEEDDRPTFFATDLASSILSRTAEKLALDFPGAYANAGPEGSLRISWACHGGHVRLICGGSPRNKTYIYLERGKFHDVAEKITADGLASSLRWLMAS